MQINLNSAAARKKHFKYLLDRYINDVSAASKDSAPLTSPSTGLFLAKSQKLNREALIKFVYACIDESIGKN